MLQVNNLHAQAGEKKILNGITLTVNRGEVHAVMGPNGSGKSTLAQVLAGHPAYQVTEGTVTRWLTADGVTWSRRAAASKVPVSMMASRVARCSGWSRMKPC